MKQRVVCVHVSVCMCACVCVCVEQVCSGWTCFETMAVNGVGFESAPCRNEIGMCLKEEDFDSQPRPTLPPPYTRGCSMGKFALYLSSFFGWFWLLLDLLVGHCLKVMLNIHQK